MNKFYDHRDMKNYGPKDVLLELAMIKSILQAHYLPLSTIYELAGCDEDRKLYDNCSSIVRRLVSEVDRAMNLTEDLVEDGTNLCDCCKVELKVSDTNTKYCPKCATPF